MPLKGLANFSWQKGSLLAVQISVSYTSMCQHTERTVFSSTYRLQSLLDLRVEGSGLDGNDLRSGFWVMGDGRTAFRAKDTVNWMAGRALPSPALDWALNRQLGLGDNGDECWEDYVSWIGQTIGQRAAYSRSIHSGAGSHRSGRTPQCRACQRRWSR